MHVIYENIHKRVFCWRDATNRDLQSEQAAPPGHRRQLQDGEGTDGHGTLSADTLAIVFSVLVGVCGYLMQAWTSNKASRHAGDLQREHDQQARDMQVEQDRTQAQVRRTERWVDDCCMPVNRALGEYSQARMRFGKCRHMYFVVYSRLSLEVLRMTTSLENDGMVQCRAVAAFAHKVETTQPAVFAELYKSYTITPVRAMDFARQKSVYGCKF